MTRIFEAFAGGPELEIPWRPAREVDVAAMVQLTVLNAMADPDIRVSVRKHAAWNLRWLDLKDGIFGKSVADLGDDEARDVRELAEAAGLGVQCLSTVLFDGDIESGPEAFRAAHLQPIGRVIALAGILRPVRIRLLAARTGSRNRLSAPRGTSCASTPGWWACIVRRPIGSRTPDIPW